MYEDENDFGRLLSCMKGLFSAKVFLLFTLVTLTTSLRISIPKLLLQNKSFKTNVVIKNNFSSGPSFSSFPFSISMKREIHDDDDSDVEPPKRKKATKSSSTASSSSSFSSISSSLPFCPPNFNATRARTLNSCAIPSTGNCVVLWMSRDQRVEDNYALLYAQGLAEEKGVPLKVVFNLVPKFLEATIRQYGFMIKGLQEVETQLRSKNIPMYLLMGDPAINIEKFSRDEKAYCVVCDFSPLRVPLMWTQSVGTRLNDGSEKIPVVQVDAHNVVPCWIASNKLEYGARTIRPKINTKLSEYLKEIPPVSSSNPASALSGCHPIDWTAALESLEIDRTVAEVNWLVPGATGAKQMLDSFVEDRLKLFEEKRNDPNIKALSNLSPYIHFGQISVQSIVLHLKKLKKFPGSTDSFIEEAVVRRELADNFCFYNPNYDSLTSLYDWAKETLRVHSADTRSVVYTRVQLESANTHDDLWNAAQLQMKSEGKMHGFLRMYWAKKILEWTSSPEEALRIAIYLNDKYNLDGRDPNGYVGCMWSIGGIHDQGWAEREVFGKIRYMNYAGCKRKFDVKTFVAKYPPALANANAATTRNPKAIK